VSKLKSERDKIIMEKTKLILKIILSPFISVLILFLTEWNLFVYPLILSLIISISNYKLYRDSTKGIILSLIFSYLSFFAGYFGWGLFLKAIEAIGITNDIHIGNWFYTDLAFLISAFIIAPLLTLKLNKSLFENTKTKTTLWIIIITIGILVLISFIHNNQDVENYFNIMNVWHLIILFGLQLIINQKSIRNKI
jgi:hypothetical protein